MSTCPQEPGRLEAEHIWFLARTPGPDSQRPGFHPCAEREPAGLQSAEGMNVEGIINTYRHMRFINVEGSNL